MWSAQLPYKFPSLFEKTRVWGEGGDHMKTFLKVRYYDFEVMELIKRNVTNFPKTAWH